MSPISPMRVAADSPPLTPDAAAPLASDLAAEMTRRALRTVAFEAHEMSVERHQELALVGISHIAHLALEFGSL